MQFQMSPLRIIFMGTADLAAVVLKALLTVPDYVIVGVVTQPDRPKGRDLALVPTAVKELALQHQLPVWQPEKARDPAFIEQLKAAAADLIVVAAYGQILPRAILELPRHGCLNVHTSLLPKFRGAAPIQWAILEGEAETGVTIMKMDAGMDTGDIVTQAVTPITAADNGQTLHDRLAIMGGELLLKTLPDYVAGRIKPRQQPVEGVSHARKITKEDGRIDWRQAAVRIASQVRAFTPWPGAYTLLAGTGKAQLLKIWEATPGTASGEPGSILEAGRSGLIIACGSGSLQVTRLQREGGKKLDAAAFLAGTPLPAGQVLGT
jgi:methionyl-tRNA formyltransferase